MYKNSQVMSFCLFLFFNHSHNTWSYPDLNLHRMILSVLKDIPV